MSLLKLQKVSKIYQMNEFQVKALDDVNLVIKKGEFVAIQGPSGSGKSTLMHIMGLLDTPSKGKVVFEDKNVSKLSEADLAKIRNKKVGFVFQSFNLLARTSALDNVVLPLIYGHSNNIAQEKEFAKEVLGLVGLEKRIGHFSSQLSGGEQQRVAIARALVNRPSIILADEPTGNLDSKSGKGIMEILGRLHKEGNTIVMITHENDVARQAQRIVKIKDGKIE